MPEVIGTASFGWGSSDRQPTNSHPFTERHRMTTTVAAVNLLTDKVQLPTAWGDKSIALLRLDRWLWSAQDLVNKNYAQQFPSLTPSMLEMSDGRRYIRIDSIVDGGNGQRSVWAFIDKQSGDILKPAGYKTPAKHARGNLFDSEGGLGSLTPYGPAYLKRGNS